MALEIPVSDKIPEQMEVAVDLSVLKELLGMSDELLGGMLFEDAEVIKKACTQINRKIDANLLFKLYFFANEYWLKNSAAELSDSKIDLVRCTRRLRDACKKEITRRNLD